VRQGRGRYTWPPGAPPAPGARPAAPGGAAATCACYEGGYAAGLREGQGTMTYPDGGRYEGARRPCSLASARIYRIARLRDGWLYFGNTVAACRPSYMLQGLAACRSLRPGATCTLGAKARPCSLIVKAPVKSVCYPRPMSMRAAARRARRERAGEWAAGARAGFGTYWYPGRGDMYQGAWRAGRRHGQGSQHCAALEAQYIGDWCAGGHALSAHAGFVRPPGSAGRALPRCARSSMDQRCFYDRRRQARSGCVQLTGSAAGADSVVWACLLNRPLRSGIACKTMHTLHGMSRHCTLACCILALP